MTKNPVKIIVALGFTGVLALMGLISLISLSQMNAITEQTRALLEETNAKTSAAHTMRDSIRLRGNTLFKMYLTDDFIKRDEYRLDILQLALQYDTARSKLDTFHTSARETKLLDQLIKQTRTAKALNDLATENLLSDLPNETILNNLQLASKARQKVLSGLDELVLLQEKITQEIIDETKQHQESISNIILLLSLAAFFIAVFIALLVIRETTRKNSEIQFQATHDYLTKLVNRKEFNHRLTGALNTAKNNQKNHVLCFLDLDKFKTINDTCGHKAGDKLLIQLTTLINEHIRSRDTLARIGGDEFGLLLEDCSVNKAIEIAEGIVCLIKNHEFIWQDKKYHVGISIGVSVITKNTQSTETVLSQADSACYVAKEKGRSQVRVYNAMDDNNDNTLNELRWTASSNCTAGNDQFTLHLQPIKNIQTKQSLAMYEVLLRLNDNEGSLVSPQNYIATAERFDLVEDVDRWVIKQCFKHLAELVKTSPNSKVQFFINISENSLTNYSFAEFIIRQHAKYNIAHGSICLEISETEAIKNIHKTMDVISSLRNYNIKFALDNYGAETLSFSYLKILSVDYLKINDETIKNMSRDTTERAMVAAINQIGKVMGIKVIAKHVEDVFTLNQLKDIGIEYAQGFYLDKPKDIVEHLKSIKASTPQQLEQH